MATVAGFERLRVWHSARKLAVETYRLTESFPAVEQYGMVSQIRRASVSVMSSIAEGQGRFSRQEFLRFLYIARGSLMEVKSLAILAQDLGYFSSEEAKGIAEQYAIVGSQLSALIAATLTQISKNKRDIVKESSPKYKVLCTKHSNERM